MAIDVTARHMHVDADIQEHARAKAKQIVDEFPRVEHVHVILDISKHRNIAEVTVQAKNHIRLEAEDVSENMIASIDHAIGRIEKQLRRQRDKVQEHRNKGNKDLRAEQESTMNGEPDED